MSGCGIGNKLRRRCNIFFPQRAVADVVDRRQIATSVRVVCPRYTCLLESVWQGLEIEAGQLLSSIAFAIDYGDRSPGTADAVGTRPRVTSVVNRPARLGCNGKKMIREAGTMNGSEVFVGQNEMRRVCPIVGNSLSGHLGVSGQATTGHTGHQVEFIHLPFVNG